MKDLNLATYGVAELNEVEMENTNGGKILEKAIGLLIEIYNHRDEIKAGIVDGWNSYPY